MKDQNSRDLMTGQRYEIIFCIFLLASVFLCRDNGYLVYPQILYLFVLLLSLNLLAGWAFHRWPAVPGLAVAGGLSNCAVITAIVAYSGGPESNLWVLYLLPIYAVCLALSGKQLALIVIGIICFNGVFHGLNNEEGFSALMTFNMSVKAGLFIFASSATWAVAQKEQKAKEKIVVQRVELQRLEEAIKQQQTDFQEIKTMANIGQISSGIAHDLTGPITVIIGTVKMLLEDDDENLASYKSDLERIERASQLCHTITTNVLEFARQKEMKVFPCNIHDVLDSALGLYEPLLAQRDIRVTKHYTDSLPFISANPVQLQRVFLNLMSNARSAMAGGGHFRIETRRAQQPGLLSGWIQVIVEDTGPGFSAGTLAKIFKPFNTTKPSGEGTGLGLYLSRQIVANHKGQFCIENKTEGGARFTLSFPSVESITGVEMIAAKKEKVA